MEITIGQIGQVNRKLCRTLESASALVPDREEFYPLLDLLREAEGIADAIDNALMDFSEAINPEQRLAERRR